MKRKVALVAVLTPKVPLVILDEPTNTLDPKGDSPPVAHAPRLMVIAPNSATHRTRRIRGLTRSLIMGSVICTNFMAVVSRVFVLNLWWCTWPLPHEESAVGRGCLD